MSYIEFRRAAKADFEAVVRLQNANLATVLSEAEKTDGFLSGGFDAAQYERMDRDGCVIVACDEQQCVGFLAAGTIEFNRPFALPAALIEQLPIVTFNQRPVNDYQVCIAGPVCVAREQRGKGVFGQLYEKLLLTLPADIELIVTLVSTTNSRSLGAHKKVGLQQVGEFSFDGKIFAILVKQSRTFPEHH